jgi:hypothetical protein
MSELWWAEAVIPQDRDPDWTAAHLRIDDLSAAAISSAIPDYVFKLSDATLAEAGLRGHWEYEYEPIDIVQHPQLTRLIRAALHADLDRIAEMIDTASDELASLKVGDFVVLIYFSGFSSDGPDGICDAWLELERLGVLHDAGFVPTGAAGRWWARRAEARAQSSTETEQGV